MKVRLEVGRTSDTYRCAHCEVTERGPGHQAVKNGLAPVGFEVQLVGISAVDREREVDGRVKFSSELMQSDGITVRCPGDADVIYLMNDKGDTFIGGNGRPGGVLRPKPEWQR